MKIWKFSLLLILALAMMTGCSPKEDTAVEDAAPAVETKPPQLLNFALPGNPDSLDPHKTSGTLTFQVCKSLYDTLAEPDADGKLVPALAESWEVSEDSLVWTFKLRSGVVFHNGDAFTSKDVLATMKRVRDEEGGSAHFSEFSAIDKIDTPDDYTVIFTLSKPTAPFLSSLASGWGAILPASLIESDHDFDAAPVGTGPFKMVEWVRDSKIVLEKNSDYWMAGKPSLDGVSMFIIPEASVQVQSLVANQVDVVFIVDNDDIPMLESSPDVKLEENLTALIMVMAMNCENPVLSDLRVRQAINHAIDKQQILDIAYGGGETIDSFMDRSSPYYKEFNYYDYDPDKAMALLAEAGVGSDVEFEMFLPQNYALHVKAGEMYQEMLSKVGLNVKIQLVDWSTWISDVYRGHNFDFTVIGHTGKLDPHGTLSGYGAGKYVSWYDDETAELLSEAETTIGYEARRPLYQEALEKMAREVPFVFLGSSYRTTGLRNNIEGFRITPKLDTFDFRWTEIK